VATARLEAAMLEPLQVTAASTYLPAQGLTLASLVAPLERVEVRGDPAIVVTDVGYRSNAIQHGALFFCVQGAHADGHDFAGEACAAGASAVVVERWLDALPCPQVRVPSVREAMGPMSAELFGRPSEQILTVGVTGTNGKTTTTYLLESIYRASGLVPGVIGTTGVRLDGRPIPFERTTPEAPDLQRLLAAMHAAGVRAVGMEVSSHGLHQHRVDGTRYRSAIFTNLSRDHLDYHGTLEEYFRSKARLFTPQLADQAVVNGDTAEGRLLADRSLVPTTTYGLSLGVELRAADVEVSASGLAFEVDGVSVRSKLRGTFNVYNCLCAFVASRQVGIEDDAIVEGLATVRGVPGRLEPVEVGQPFTVLVDYAHTPDSVENVLRAARELTPTRLITVLGCGGDRDRGKRPLMGEAATRLSDLAVITSDNPRSEDPDAIIAEIELGARRVAASGGGRYVTESDRRLAIRLAIHEAGPQDVVVIAGKGHETGQEFADRTIPFDDRVVAAEELGTYSVEDGAG
jgi:UDP-N-acetylmuramoyl-L-alanyl-D-glutamate--2,6-diaminopimelate ligase